MDLVEVMGKMNRKVPVLLTPAMKAGIDLLNSTRNECGVSEENPYVFAKGNENYITGAEALNHVLKNIPNLKHPENLRLPKLRKYLATVTQLFGLEDTDLQEVARHMGHELAVHRKFYRLQDDVIELAKISKLLLAVESGKAHQFSGLSIDDIELDQLPSISDEEAITAPLKSKEEEPSVSDENTITASLKSEEELPSVSDEIDVSITAPLKSEEGRPVRNKRIFKPDVFGFDDSDRNKTEDVSSDSDDEVGRRIKKRKKCENEKKVWSECEKKMLMPLVMSSVRDGRPPVKKSILKFKKETSMEKLPWLKIKYQVWAMAQSEMKKNKKITDELGMQ